MKVLAHMAFPRAYRQQQHSTKPLEPLEPHNVKIKHRIDVGGLPLRFDLTWLVTAILPEQTRSDACTALHAVDGV
ncbi:transposase [Pseudomonas amygdali pv. loropetali]|nr:transposase [Pseudomonas amygdali]UPT39911.1 transposase [Pseudomonas amygdali pv. loropetali]